MSRLLRCLSLLLAASLVGCAGPFAPVAFDFPVDKFPTPAPVNGESEDLTIEQLDPKMYARMEAEMGMDAVKRLKELARNRPPLRRPASEEESVNLTAFPHTSSAIATRILLAATPRGAYVRCRTSSEHKYSGRVLKVDNGEVVLINCVYTTFGATADGGTQAIVGYAPSKSLSAGTLTDLYVFSVPKDEAEAHRLLRQDPKDVVREVAFKSGRRHRLDADPEDGAAAAGAESLAEVPAGSVVRWTDVKGRRVEGTVVGTECGATTLQNCVSRVVVPGPNGEGQEKTSVMPFISLSAGEVRDLVLLKLPLAGFGPDEEADCCDHCVDAFVLASGRREVSGIPYDEDAAQ